MFSVQGKVAAEGRFHVMDATTPFSVLRYFFQKRAFIGFFSRSGLDPCPVSPCFPRSGPFHQPILICRSAPPPATWTHPRRSPGFDNPETGNNRRIGGIGSFPCGYECAPPLLPFRDPCGGWPGFEKPVRTTSASSPGDHRVCATASHICFTSSGPSSHFHVALAGDG